jgi:hypothetical protein
MYYHIEPTILPSMAFHYRSTIPLLLLLTTLATGCTGRAGNSSGDWVGSIETAGNVTQVRTEGGSVWGGTARLLEEAVIGREETDAHRLGEVRAIVISEAAIYVVDLSVPVVHMYDLEGHHLRDIGRHGEGPGEFVRPLAAGLDPISQRLYIRDSMGARINVYTLGGTPLETWRIQTTRPFTSPLVVDQSGTPYTQIVLDPSVPYLEQQHGMASCGPGGIGTDTLAIPDVEYRPLEVEFAGGTRSMIRVPVPFGPEVIWAMTPQRAVVLGASDAYRFEVHHPDGRVRIIEKPWLQVPVENEEAAWNKGRLTAQIRRDVPDWEWQGPGIPSYKPAFQHFLPDRDGRIWVVRQGPGERLEGGLQEPEDWRDYFWKPAWEDTYLLDVFDEEGRYLGDVELPPGLQFSTLPCIRGDRFVALRTEPDGTPLVICYRLVLPDNNI